METKHSISILLYFSCQYNWCSVGPAQLVPQSLPVTCITCYLHWDANAFKLKLPVSYIEMLLLYATKSTINTIIKIPEILCELFQRLDSFSEGEVLAFRELLYLSGGRKCYQQPMGNLYDSKFLPHLKAAISCNRLLLLIIFCCLMRLKQETCAFDQFGHILEIWYTFNNRCRELYETEAHATIDSRWCLKSLLLQCHTITFQGK